MKRLLFVYNPNAGRGYIRQHLDSLIEIFESAQYRVDIFRIQENYPPNGMDIVATKGVKYDRVVCSGGDGTLNHVVSSIMKIEPELRPVIGFIPTGSTNDTGKSFDLPVEVKKAGRMVVEGEAFATDIGHLNDQFFTYVASFGELPAVSAFTPQQAKKMFGRVAYITEGIKALLKMESNHIVCRYDGGKTLEGDYLLGIISNSTSVGGFSGIMGDDVNLQDGMFEAVFVKRPANLNELNVELDAVLMPKEESRGLAAGLVARFKASEIEISSDSSIQWVKDGEDAGRHKVAIIKNENKAVRIITGPKLYNSEG